MRRGAGVPPAVARASCPCRFTAKMAETQLASPEKGRLSRRNRSSRSQPLLHLVVTYYARLLRHDMAAREHDEVGYGTNIEAGSNLRVLFCVHFQH